METQALQISSAAGTNNLEVCKCRVPEDGVNLAAANWHNKE